MTTPNLLSVDNISALEMGNSFYVTLFYICLVIAAITFIGLAIAIRKRIRIKKGLAVNTSGNAAAIALLTPIFLCCIGGMIYVGIGRKATNRDIDVNFDQKITMNMTFEITPEVDIDGLELKFEFEDKNGNIVTTKTKKLNDVEKGKTYKIYIQLNEFNLSQILDMYGVSTNVIGGRVSYL